VEGSARTYVYHSGSAGVCLRSTQVSDSHLLKGDEHGRSMVEVFTAGFAFFLGSLISAQGQILTATLDSAVNTPRWPAQNRPYVATSKPAI
jgi:hypothetical protein